MYIGTFFTGFIWAIFGACLMYGYMKNKTSANPNSYKDEIADLKRYLQTIIVEARTAKANVTPMFIQVPVQEVQVAPVQEPAPDGTFHHSRADDTPEAK